MHYLIFNYAFAKAKPHNQNTTILNQFLSHKKFIVLQHDQKDCGCACLKMALRYYGGDENLEYLKELSGTNRRGTSFLGMIQAGAIVGLEAIAYNASIDDIKSIKVPYVLQVEDQGMLHYIICFLYDVKKGFLMGDPAIGMRYYSERELLEKWKSGNLLTLEKTPALVQKKLSRYGYIPWLMSMIRQDNAFYISAIFLGVVIALLGMTTLVFTEKLVDVVLPSRDLGLLFKTLGIWFFLLIVILVLSYLRSRILVQQAYRFNIRIFSFFFKRLLYMPKSFYDSKKQGDMIARMNDTQRIQRNIKTIIADSFIELFTLVIAAIVLFVYSQGVALLVLVSLPTLLMCTLLYNPAIKKLQHLMFSRYAIVESKYIDTIGGITPIKVYNREEELFSENSSEYNNFQKAMRSLVNKDVSQSFIIGISGTIITAAGIAYAVLQVYERFIEVGDLIAIISLVGIVVSSIEGLVQLNFEILESRVAIERMFDFIQRSDAIDKNEIIDSKVLTEEIKSIEIKGLFFSYPGQEPIITNGNVALQKGVITYLIGNSGSGKSTLAQLLLKFYKPLEGTVDINKNIPLSTISKKEWRSYVSYVPQSIKIFNDTILYNIGSKTGMDNNAIEDFCRVELGLEDFFLRFKDGFNTILGEEGVLPSGGEKQIIGLVRALIHKPKILLLDEATSSLDEAMQSMILDLLEKVKKDKIILFITHDKRVLRGSEGYIYELKNKAIKKIES